MIPYFEHIAGLDKTVKNISLQVVDGPSAGAKALWRPKGFFFTSEELPVFEAASADLPQITGPTLKTYGEDTVFFEVLSSPPNMIICGCGHVSMSIIKLGKMLGFHVTAIDDRPQFCDNARRAEADHVICDNFEHGLSQVPDDANNYYIIVTRGHRYDMACLKQLLYRPHTYIGMMGSRFRIKQLKETLVEEGFEMALLDQVHMPIGLKIKAETPEEIAVSIAAEIIQIKNETNTTYAYDKQMLEALIHPDTELACAMATIIRRRGSAPRSAGTKMLIYEDGRCIGTIGGGCAEAAVISQALQNMRTKKWDTVLSTLSQKNRSLVKVDMTGREAEDEGMVCGGVIDVLIETL